jgi:hypothetical protein
MRVFRRVFYGSLVVQLRVSHSRVNPVGALDK